MKVKVTGVKYPVENNIYPVNFVFEIEDEIVTDDDKLSTEVYRLIKEETGMELLECDVDVD